jgi:prepilin-type N-terminal cleavage/methylation domain-containing protein
MEIGTKGFSLVELLVVLGLAAILMTLATLQTKQWQEKSSIEGQATTLYGGLMEARQRAMNLKQPTSVVVKPASLLTYSTSTTSAGVGAQKSSSLKYKILSGSSQVASTGEKITFNEDGFTANNISLCIEPSGSALDLNSAAFDSIVVHGLRIRMGKRNGEGASCAESNINLK